MAARALYTWDILPAPALRSTLMSTSTVIVAVKARLLRTKE